MQMFCNQKIGQFLPVDSQCSRRQTRAVPRKPSSHRAFKDDPAHNNPSIRIPSITFPFTLPGYCGPFNNGRSVRVQVAG